MVGDPPAHVQAQLRQFSQAASGVYDADDNTFILHDKGSEDFEGIAKGCKGVHEIQRQIKTTQVARLPPLQTGCSLALEQED